MQLCEITFKIRTGVERNVQVDVLFVTMNHLKYWFWLKIIASRSVPYELLFMQLVNLNFVYFVICEFLVFVEYSRLLWMEDIFVNLFIAYHFIRQIIFWWTEMFMWLRLNLNMTHHKLQRHQFQVSVFVAKSLTTLTLLL